MEVEDQFRRFEEESVILCVPLCSRIIHTIQSNYVYLLCPFRITEDEELEENPVILHILPMKCVVYSDRPIVFVSSVSTLFDNTFTYFHIFCNY
jgi:hypothetical protein